MATGAISDKPKPTFPAFDCDWFNSGGIELPAFILKSFHICAITSMAVGQMAMPRNFLTLAFGP
jgi:hypothetical protein